MATNHGHVTACDRDGRRLDCIEVFAPIDEGGQPSALKQRAEAHAELEARHPEAYIFYNWHEGSHAKPRQINEFRGARRLASFPQLDEEVSFSLDATPPEPEPKPRRNRSSGGAR